MNPRKLLVVVFSIILASAVFLPVAVADEWNQATKMNFSEPVEIPGVVLPAGTYWFVLADSQGDQQIVQVFSATERRSMPPSRLYRRSDCMRPAEWN